MLMCLWLEPLFLVVTDRDTYTYGGGPGHGTCFVPAALLSCLPCSGFALTVPLTLS